MNAIHNLKLFLRQSLDQISDYDLVAEHSNSWHELRDIDPVQRSIVLKELENRKLTADTKTLLQRLYILGMTDHQMLLIRISGVCSLVSLLMSLIIDWMLVPDIFWFAFGMKVFIIAPIGVWAYILADRKRDKAYFPVILVFIATELTIVGFMFLSREPLAWVYGYGIAVVCSSGNLMESLPTKKAVILTLLSVLLVTVAFVFNTSITLPVLILSLFTCYLFCMFSLVANYRLEVVLRRQYVNALQEKLRVENLVELNKELNEHALVDSVTGIGNRRFLDTKIASYYTAFSVSRQPLGLLMIDIDQFKSLNDRHGHVVGDVCLRRIAESLASGIRSATDLVARYGGEEFVIVLPGASPRECFDLAERLRVKIEKTPILVEGASEPIVLTVSIGCDSAIPSVDGDIIEFVERADAALYEAKRQGRNKVVLSGFEGPENFANAV